MAEEMNEEVLSKRHKKERREMQAQIQTLKKSICKGDKKRKREVTEEIMRMESDLDTRHEEELINFKLSQVTLTGLPSSETVINSDHDDDKDGKADVEIVQRISKAQRRRDKKALAERERSERIIEQETLNVFGKRTLEAEAIEKILCERDLKLYEIPSDGHCLYNAVAHQLKLLGDMPHGLQDLRTKTASHLRANMNDFLPFLSNPDSDELFSSEQYEKYCNDVANTSAWGGAIELQVLSQVLKCPIEVIQATGVPYIIGSEFEHSRKVTLTYHRHMYKLGAHYNSVSKIAKDEDS
ncbi:OTU domain-containing protein 6B [Fopius arisanus]|uniref:OTU domain-containing protein 6B n=2 Tax=Fopius arisanus TaxID=64838 RepID=A0A0C9QVT3_9HYME|nr:PREDICTED: OTU domain-containing protein 6B [Fopius arisanus]